MEGKMKILVLGASGMAGHTITVYLNDKGYDVTAFTRTPFNLCKNIIGNVEEEGFLSQVLLKNNYDAVINCIGILNKEADDNKSVAVYLNSYLPHFIADCLRDTKTKLIHMSTDCVFSGKTGGYSENSLRDGESFYDRTKALGEVIDDKNLTLRNSIIGPDMREDGIGLFNWFMKQSGTINGYTKAIWTGVTTITLAKAMEIALKENLSGLYNLVNNTTISKYELCSLFNKYFRNGEIEIKPSDEVKLNKSLINNRKDFSFTIPSYEQMMIEMLEWINSHRALYPHYFGEGLKNG
jgi:dTDP-4-dehydrorhamnose reductase